MKLEQERGERVSRNQGKNSQGQDTERQSAKVSKNIREGSLSQNFITVQLLSSWLTTQSLSSKPKGESDDEQRVVRGLKIHLCRKHSSILCSILETLAMTYTFSKKIPKREIYTKLASIQFIVPSVSRDAYKSKWQPTPVFLPGESQGRGSLVGCRLWVHTQLDTTGVTQQQQQYSYVPTPRKAQEPQINITLHWCEHSPGPPSSVRRHTD